MKRPSRIKKIDETHEPERDWIDRADGEMWRAQDQHHPDLEGEAQRADEPPDEQQRCRNREQKFENVQYSAPLR